MRIAGDGAWRLRWPLEPSYPYRPDQVGDRSQLRSETAQTPERPIATFTPTIA